MGEPVPLHLLRTCKQQRLSAGIEARAVGEAGARGLIRTPPLSAVGNPRNALCTHSISTNYSVRLGVASNPVSQVHTKVHDYKWQMTPSTWSSLKRWLTFFRSRQSQHMLLLPHVGIILTYENVFRV